MKGGYYVCNHNKELVSSSVEFFTRLHSSFASPALARRESIPSTTIYCNLLDSDNSIEYKGITSTSLAAIYGACFAVMFSCH